MGQGDKVRGRQGGLGALSDQMESPRCDKHLTVILRCEQCSRLAACEPRRMTGRDRAHRSLRYSGARHHSRLAGEDRARSLLRMTALASSVTSFGPDLNTYPK